MSSSTRNRLKMHIFDVRCTWVLIFHRFPRIYDFSNFSDNFENNRSGAPSQQYRVLPDLIIWHIPLQFMSSSTRNRITIQIFPFLCTPAIISHRFPPFYDFSVFPQNFENVRSGDPPVHQPKLAPTIILQALLSANSGPSKLENCSISFPKTMRVRHRI